MAFDRSCRTEGCPYYLYGAGPFFIGRRTPTKVESWQLTIDIETYTVCHGQFRGGS